MNLLTAWLPQWQLSSVLTASRPPSIHFLPLGASWVQPINWLWHPRCNPNAVATCITATSGPNTCAGTLVANTTGTASGTPATDWACTRDNVTGLVWGLQTQTVSWNTATGASYPDAGHNTPGRCGYSTNWRLLTTHELLSIVYNRLPNYSTAIVDVAYFPATQADWYWTSDTYAPDPAFAWFVYF